MTKQRQVQRIRAQYVCAELLRAVLRDHRYPQVYVGSSVLGGWIHRRAA